MDLVPDPPKTRTALLRDVEPLKAKILELETRLAALERKQKLRERVKKLFGGTENE
jgi:hypothetical protein